MPDEPSDGLEDQLELDLPPGPIRVGPGRTQRPFHAEYVRDLTEADMAALAVPRGIKPKSLVRIHASHHALAKCLAMGMTPSQAALVTGYDGPRISVLQNDPAFAALIQDYRTEVRHFSADLAERMANMSLDAIEMLHERLHSNPQEFGIALLLDMVRTFADRTGHGPGQEVSLRVAPESAIDRPPRESHEEWQRRRAAELGGEAPPHEKLAPSKAGLALRLIPREDPPDGAA